MLLPPVGIPMVIVGGLLITLTLKQSEALRTVERWLFIGLATLSIAPFALLLWFG